LVLWTDSFIFVAKKNILINFSTKKMKRNLILMLMALAVASVSAQNYTVDFYADGAGADLQKVYLFNVETNALIDSFSVDHARAHIEGSFAGLPVLAAISPAPNLRMPYATFILDTEATSITLNMIERAEGNNPYGGVSIKGSDMNKRLNEVADKFAGHVSELMGMMTKLRENVPAGSQPTEAQLEDYRKAASGVEEALVADFKQALETERDNKISLYALIQGNQFIDASYAATYLEGYAFADVPALRRMRADIESKKLRMPGAEMIDFEMADQVGTMHKLSEFVGKGRYVMVDFWASWCGPCRQEMPNVKAAYERFHDKGFDIVAVSFDNSRDAWLKGIADLGMTWTQLSDLKGWECLAGQLYKIHSIPCTILFGPDGKVVAADLRGDALAKTLEERLK